MGIYKKGRYWWFKKVFKGKKFEESLSTTNRKLAETRFAKKLTAITDGVYLDRSKDVLMKEVVGKYINELSPLLSATTHVRNKQIASKFINFFGDTLIKDVSAVLLSEYKSKRLNEVQPATVKKELAFLRRVFTVAIDEWEMCKYNPVKKIIRSLAGDNKRVRYISAEEAQKLRFTLPAWLKPIILVTTQTGLRRGNVIGLQTDHVDFLRNLIIIPTTKNGEPVAIPMTSMVKETLQNVLRERKVISSFVFCDEKGEPLRLHQVSMAFKRSCDRAEIKDLRFHDTRHHFASSLVQAGVDLYRVQKLMGHKDQRMTQRYAHLAPENLRAAIRVLEYEKSATNLLQEKGLAHASP